MIRTTDFFESEPMFVVHVDASDGESTRLVIGCESYAEHAVHVLRESGFSARLSVDPIPERDAAEIERAYQFMAIIFKPTEGNA